jgi:hypothetical protein
MFRRARKPSQFLTIRLLMKVVERVLVPAAAFLEGVWACLICANGLTTSKQRLLLFNISIPAALELPQQFQVLHCLLPFLVPLKN